MSDAIKDKIFEPFFTTRPAGEGTGLSLSLSYDIVVKQHGGQLTVESQVDASTEFVVTLPRAMAVGDRASRLMVIAPESGWSGPHALT